MFAHVQQGSNGALAVLVETSRLRTENRFYAVVALMIPTGQSPSDLCSRPFKRIGSHIPCSALVHRAHKWKTTH